MATFGEMVLLADQHLAEVNRALFRPRFDRQLRAATVRAELSRFTHVLVRYHDKIATGFGAPHDEQYGIRDAAHRAGRLIEQAERLLGPASHIDTPTSELRDHLRSASIALGCGLDLLSTHFPPSNAQELSPDAAIITSTDTARSLLHGISGCTATAAHVARRGKPPVDQAGTLLLKAAVLARFYGQADTLITALPANGTPDRIPPTSGEDLTEAETGISVSIDRLKHLNAADSITTWRYLARAAVIICDISTKITRHLAHRMTELDEKDHASTFENVIPAIRHTSLKWRSITHRWENFTDHHSPPTSDPSIDASDLILRLGRLAFADPQWTPSPRASYRMKQPSELGPDFDTATRVATAVLRTIEACNVMAGDHAEAINDVAALLVLRKSSPVPGHLPRPPAAVYHLRDRYRAAQTYGRQAVTTLGQAIQSLPQRPQGPIQEIDLIIRRTSIYNRKSISQLSLNDLPSTIRQLPQESHPLSTHSSPTSSTSNQQARPKKR
ncbi:hypothetical protein [Actinomadura roseirufa]|uniref:hypothetical protein n=1 Tax=Actinomadura roseirufa TaxID=2094049 RepID=UPI0013F167C2|nr:hypothetical protein [Actinomadura roseirufa]